MSNMTIGKAASNAGVGVETVRFYERRGLIDQPPTPANYPVGEMPAPARRNIVHADRGSCDLRRLYLLR